MSRLHLSAALLGIVLLHLIAAGIGLAAASDEVGSIDTGGVEDERIVYKQTPQGELSLYIIRPDVETFDGPRPAVLFFHGGGWVKGNAKAFFDQSEALAERGVVAINAEYRLKNKHETTPIDATCDGFSAIRYVRENAESLGVDPQRIAAGGGSAGGHMAAALATLDPADFTDPGASPAEASIYRPDALVLFCPVYDSAGYGRKLFGDDWRKYSPAHHLHADMPPTLVQVGGNDKLLPVETAERFRDGMRDLGVRSELIVYDGQGHGFFVRNQSEERYAATLDAMLEFLGSLGYVD